MSLVEQAKNAYCQNVLRIRREFPELRPTAPTLLGIGVLLHLIKHHSIVEGYPLPPEGAGIVAGNHYLQSDSYEAALAGWRSGRLIRPVIKKSLIEKGAYESVEYLMSIGDKRDQAEYNPINAYVMKGIGGVPILRDNPGINYAKTCHQILDSGQLLGMFLQASRDEDGLLRNFMPGVAFFASHEKHRDKPVYLIAFSKERAKVLKPFTYNQKREELGRDISLAELTVIFADQIAAALSEDAQLDWQTRREEELRRLIIITSRKKAPKKPLVTP